MNKAKSDSTAKYISKLQQEIVNYGKYVQKLRNEHKIKINSMNMEMFKKDFEIDTLQTKVNNQGDEIERLKKIFNALFPEEDKQEKEEKDQETNE